MVFGEPSRPETLGAPRILPDMQQDAGPRQAGSAGGWPTPGQGRTVVRIAVWGLIAAVLLIAAWREARQYQANSDGASQALQAWQMLHGNLLLHGWRLADVSYYTTELPVYVLVEAVRGLRTDVMAISEAINYTLTVVCGILVAKGCARGREGLVRAVVVATIMVGPPQVMVSDADHAATALWVLFALLLVDRAGRRWYVPVAVGLLLAWAIVGDPLIEVIGAAPLAIVGVARACPGLFQRTVRLRERWFELSLACAGILSVPAAMGAERAIGAAGGWVLTGGSRRFAQASSLPSNLTVELQDFLTLFNANFFGRKADDTILPVAVHLAGAAAVALAIWVAARCFTQGRAGSADLVADVLVTAIACNLAAYLVMYSAIPAQIREVSPLLPLGAALAGRVLGGPLTRHRLEPVLAAVLVCYLLTLSPALTGPSRPPGNLALTGWLERHHLRNGLAGYWQANSVTLDSGTRITVRPVTGGAGGRPKVLVRETDMTQLSPAANYANFLVLATGPNRARPPITEAGATREFGKPTGIYRYQNYTIIVWNKNVLVPLAVRSDPGG